MDNGKKTVDLSDLLLGIVILFTIWYIIKFVFQIPPYILPYPQEVLAHINHRWSIYWNAIKHTILEASFGFLSGCIVAFIVGIISCISRIFRKIVEPIVVLSQTFPLQAVAPILVLWLGHGIMPIVAASALICFFPLAISSIKGLLYVDNDILAVFKALGANPIQVLIRLRIPSAFPQILNSIKICSTLSVIGAVIGEFVSPQNGLGYLILIGQSKLEIELMYGSILILGIIGITFFIITSFVEKYYLRKIRID